MLGPVHQEICLVLVCVFCTCDLVIQIADLMGIIVDGDDENSLMLDPAEAELQYENLFHESNHFHNGLCHVSDPQLEL